MAKVFNYKTGQWEETTPFVYGGQSKMQSTPNDSSAGKYYSGADGIPFETLIKNSTSQNNNQSSTSNNTSSGTSNTLTDFFNKMGSSIDQYVNDLLDFAKDDYDWAAKWIEQQFTDAMGTDDVARKDFLKEVASELENKVGTVAFDYQTGKYRLEEDTSKALNRLNEDDKVARGELNVNSQLERENQNSNLNQRGIIQGTREDATGLASRDIGILENDIKNRFDALDRVMGRNTEDIQLASKRGSEDLITSARRAGEGAVSQRTYSLEQAERERKARELEAEQTRKQQKDTLAAYGAYIA